MAKLRKQRGSKSWYIVYRNVDGKRRWKSTGTEDQAEANDMLQAVNELERSRDRVETLIEIAADMGTDVGSVLTPLTGLEGLFLATEQTASARTRRDKVGCLRRFIAWMQEEKSEYHYVQELSERLAGEYWSQMQDTGYAAKTRNRHLSALKTIFAAVRIPAGLGRNIWDAIRLARGSSISYKALSWEQVRALYGAAQEFDSALDDTWWPGAIALGCLTGLREGDICKVKVGEVNISAQFVELVPSKTARWGKGQLVHPTNVDFLRWMDLGRAAEDFVFPLAAAAKRPGGGVLADEWSELCEMVGIKHTRQPRPGEQRVKAVKMVPFHSLRHTFVTTAIDRGADERDVQRAVGHASRQMTERYNHSRCLAAAQRIADVMPSLS